MQILQFCKWKVCGNPTLRKHLSVIFITFAHLMFLHHILVVLTKCQTFYYYCICCGDLQPVIFDVAILIVLKLLELWWYIIANLIGKCCVCFDCSINPPFPSLYLFLGLIAWDKTILKSGQLITLQRPQVKGRVAHISF